MDINLIIVEIWRWLKMRQLRKDLKPVTLVKRNGETYDNILVNLQSYTNTIVTQAFNIPFEEGDLIERTLQNGIREKYLILKINQSPNYINMNIEKVVDQLKEKHGGDVYNLNVSGITGNVNVNSSECGSVINYNCNGDNDEFFDKLKEALSDSNEEVLAAVEDMRVTVGTKSFAEKYAVFMQTAAAHMTIIAPFLPQLGNF